MAFTDCSNPLRPIFYAIDDEKGRVHVIYGRCKLWSCPECREFVAWVWAKRLENGISVYQSRGLSDWQMLTVTSHEKLRGMSDCLRVWPSAWAKLSTRMRRKTKPLKYALMPELHKDSRVHVHMLTNADVSRKWLKDNARECGLGYQASADDIQSASRAVFYAVKYLGKDAGDVNWPRGFRRVRTSQRWPVLPIDENTVYNGLEWRKWPENGEKAYFRALSALGRLLRGYEFICADMQT